MFTFVTKQKSRGILSKVLLTSALALTLSACNDNDNDDTVVVTINCPLYKSTI